ncbi:MAG: COX15/CtaA family protein [Bryobacteraceae bacterium]|nr:COX15/CtaA family protein [Bryobacteraceae bacterium]MDW8377847.1 COX15/CtaA family protein [Bryobacterales bacterium]
MGKARFTWFAWFFLAYVIAVILFGAWVRITGSGAGCGNHWPTCHGEILPPQPATKTLIEFTHRLSSGFCGLLGLILLVWARRVRPAVFRAALATMFFILVEGFIGAVLVKKELVADDASVARAVVIALHLTNTLLLTASAACVAWWSLDEGRRPHISFSRPLLAVAVLSLVVANMTGAVTALGDTLFPKTPALDGSLFTKIREEITAGEHFLVRLRILHPVLAVLSAMLVSAVFLWAGGPGKIPRYGLVAVVLQLGIGLANVLLMAPGWMQILHLLMAQILWVLTWITTVECWPRYETFGVRGLTPAGSRA